MMFGWVMCTALTALASVQTEVEEHRKVAERIRSQLTATAKQAGVGGRGTQ